MSADHMEKEVGATELPGLLKKANWAKEKSKTHVPKSQSIWSVLVSYTQAGLGGYLVDSGLCSEAGKGRCGHPGCKRRSLWKEEWASCSIQHTEHASLALWLPSGYSINNIGRLQVEYEIIIAIATIYWAPALVRGLLSIFTYIHLFLISYEISDMILITQLKKLSQELKT